MYRPARRRASVLAAACASTLLVYAPSLRAAPLDPGAFTSLGTLNVTAGTLTINTDTLTLSGAASFTGATFDQGTITQNGITDFDRTVAVFDFTSVNVAAGVTISVTGSRPLAILSRSSLSIASPISLDGGTGADARAGGAPGATAASTRGSGPGAGGPSITDGSGAGFGGAGGHGQISAGAGGPSYGELFTRLQGGSSGSTGDTSGAGAGAGGGALELGALSSINLSATLSSSGGSGSSGSNGNGGGSGGGLLLHAPTLTLSSLVANGGYSDNLGFGGGGGGGRIALSLASLTPAQFSSFLSSFAANGTDNPYNSNQAGAAGAISLRSDSFSVPAGQTASLAPFSPAAGRTTPALSVSTSLLAVPATATASLAGNNFVDPTTGTATIDGTLALGSFTQSLAFLTGAGTVSFAGGTLSLGASNVSSTLSATLSGTGTLSKIGAGSLTLLRGGPATHLNLTAGSLTVRSTNADAASFAVAANATLALSSNATLNLNGTGPAATNAGTLQVDGSSTLILANPLTNTGTITGKDATFRFNGGLANAGTFDASAARDVYGPVSNLPTGTITVKAGNSSAFHSPLTTSLNSSLSVATASTLFLSGGVTGTGSLTNSGTTRIEAGPSSLSSITGGGTLTLTSPVSLTLNSLLQSALTIQGALTLSPSGGPSETSTLSIPTGGSLNLNNNPFTLDYTGSSPLDTVRQHLLAARITSSMAANDPQHRLAIGYAESAALPVAQRATIAGLPVDDTAVLLKLTYLGDANLDGKINADDYALLDQNFAKQTTPAHWTNGDFNYDGIINNQDYLLIDQSLYTQAPGFSPGFLAERESQFGEAYVYQLLAAVPEPSALLTSVFCLLFSPLLPRRTRSKR